MGAASACHERWPVVTTLCKCPHTLCPTSCECALFMLCCFQLCCTCTLLLHATPTPSRATLQTPERRSCVAYTLRLRCWCTATRTFTRSMGWRGYKGRARCPRVGRRLTRPLEPRCCRCCRGRLLLALELVDRLADEAALLALRHSSLVPAGVQTGQVGRRQDQAGLTRDTTPGCISAPTGRAACSLFRQPTTPPASAQPHLSKSVIADLAARAASFLPQALAANLLSMPA